MRALAALMALCLSAAAGVAQARCADGDGDWIARACYTDPLETGLYGHDVLGGTPEWTAVEVTLGPKGRATLGGDRYIRRAPSRHIFEDIAPRVVQLDASGPPELILIYTDFDRGAALMVDNLETGRLSVTPHIGQRNRWLAPLGAADLDGDGVVELAYIDRPHLAKTLVVWRYGANGELTRVDSLPGLTNHRIGQDFITGGIFDCGQGPEVVTADANWQNLMATRLREGRLSTRRIGAFPSQIPSENRPPC